MKYIVELILTLYYFLLPPFSGCGGAVASSEIVSFKDSGWPSYSSREVNRNLESSKERFFVSLPSGVTSRQPVGVVVYISSDNECIDVPVDWQAVLDRNHFIFIAPQMAGNSCGSRRRAGLAVMAAMAMIRRYNVDLRRVYVAGFSGGARLACDLGFYQSDLFSGTVQISGAEFPKRIGWSYARSVAQNDQNYGFFDASEQEIASSKKTVRFALITGERDFRRPFILDIYNSGFCREGFQARLFDVPDQGHSVCSGRDFENALKYLMYGR